MARLIRRPPVRALPARPGRPAGSVPAAGRAASAPRAAIPPAPEPVARGQCGARLVHFADARVRAGRPVTVDLINSFHLHRNCFEYIPPDTHGHDGEFTDTVIVR